MAIAAGRAALAIVLVGAAAALVRAGLHDSHGGALGQLAKLVIAAFPIAGAAYLAGAHRARALGATSTFETEARRVAIRRGRLWGPAAVAGPIFVGGAALGIGFLVSLAPFAWKVVGVTVAAVWCILAGAPLRAALARSRARFEIAVERGPVALGSATVVAWSVRVPHGLRNGVIRLLAVEEVAGGDAPPRHVFHTALVASVRAATRTRGMATVTLPHDSLPTFRGRHARVRWLVALRGDTGTRDRAIETVEVEVELEVNG